MRINVQMLERFLIITLILLVGLILGKPEPVLAADKTANLPKPVLVLPNGLTNDLFPTYTWNIVPGALEYYVWVNGPTTVGLIRSWYKSTDICTSTQCSVRPMIGLSNGAHKWWVLAKNDTLMSPWSDEGNFQIQLSLPGTPTTSTPAGIVTRQPTFTWSRDYQTSWYYLWLNNSTGNILGKWYSASGVCSESTCSTNIEQNLLDGSYKWWIIAWNPSGYSSWSNGLAFVGSFVPEPPKLVSPQGELSGPSVAIKPTFTWNLISSAVEFNLALVGSNNTSFQSGFRSSDICDEKTCSVTPELNLGAGNYQWSVQAKNQVGPGPWSVVVNFTYLQTAPAAATLISPSGDIRTSQPVFRWNAVNGTDQYHLWINGPQGNIYQDWLNAGTVCNGAVCELNSPVPIGEGDHYWWIQTKNMVGSGSWSTELKFNVFYALTNPQKISPQGEITSPNSVTPIYKWNAVTGANGYILTVNKSDGTQVLTNSYQSSAVCSAGICSVQPAIGLENGEHRWYVQSRNDTGTSSLGDYLTVTIKRTPPGMATQISPNGGGAVVQPNFVWKTVTGATWYYLWVNDSQGAIIKTWYLAADVCNADTCLVTPTIALTNGQHTWWVQTWNPGGFGPWSPGMIFGSSSGAPPYSTSWYMDTVNQSTLYNMGCDMGTRDKNLSGTQDSFLVLDFGNPNYSNGVYGTALFGFGTASTNQIAMAVQQYAVGYITCSGVDTTSRVKIGIGTNNYGSGTSRNHGAAWAEMVNTVNEWLISRGYYSRVDVVGANDLEVGWNSPSASRAWVDGYDSQNKYPLYNFGDAAGCPTRLLTGRSCGTSSQPNWTLEDIWYISWGVGSAYPFPLVYATSGVNARQWQWISQYGYTSHGARMDIQGAFTQYQACQQRSGCSGMDNTPDAGWQQLWNELNFDSRTAQTTLRWSTDIKWLGE